MRTKSLSSSQIESPLERVLVASGGHLESREGIRTVAHFGRPDAEEQACRTRVGLAHRGTAPLFELLGTSGSLALATASLTGHPFLPGHATHAHGAWWCATTADRLLVICDPGDARAPAIVHAAGPPAGVSVTDRVGAFDGFQLAGPQAAALLRGLGLLPAPPIGNPTGAVFLGRLDDCLLGVVREGAERFLLFVDAADAVRTWSVLLDAGSPYGLLRVGSDALARRRQAH